MKVQISEKIKILGIFLALTFLVSIPFLNFKNLSAHDISYHVNRIIAISEELKAGQFPVLIHSNLLNGFGYANSLFYPELFLYIPAILMLLGINCVTSYKVLTIIATFFTFLFTYYSANRIFKNRNISWAVTLLYGCAFYRLTDIYVRAAVGEVLALVFLPLVLCGLYEIIFGENQKWWIICFGLFGIINSHILSFVLAIILICVICLINIKKILEDKRRLIHLIVAGIISILLTSSYVFTYLEQITNNEFNVHNTLFSGEKVKEFGLSFFGMINNNISEGASYKRIGSLLFILPMFIFKCKNKGEDNEKKFIDQLFIFGGVLLFMSTRLFPWKILCDKISFIALIQFPFRLNIIITLLFSFVSGYVICDIFGDKKELMNLLYILYILFTLSIIGTVNINKKEFTQAQMLNYAPIGNEEYVPYGFKSYDTKVYNTKNKEEIAFNRKSSKIEFYYDDTENPMTIHIPFAYYKGYIAYIEKDGDKTELTVSKDENTQNVIISNNEILSGKITVEYRMTAIQKVGCTITYVTLLLLIYYSCYKKKKA